MVKHNNEVPNAHFKKAWQTRVKVWLDQPGRKKRRRNNRAQKAAEIYPRPVSGLLRPVVRASTAKYNTKVRYGRGFTLEELRAANVNPKEARNIGIAVDYRRKNASVDTLNANVQRLNLYKAKLVVFPRKAGQPRSGDADAAQLANVVQQQSNIGFKQSESYEKARVITDEEKEQSAYLTIMKIRSKLRHVGDEIKAENEAKKKL
eukprot:TRINITY_DN12161_c0_g1_i1.p1 TRINITY_DN12161_c0_g1~~TRINITY_DN12161_c0_g1_i1.p1  ORF type:complete len:205 (-),score=67.52 TRINITY_DN12161_c0_g1_i1:109-723(-)